MATPVSSISASDPSAECFATYKAVENENPDQARENVNGPNDRSSSLSDIEDRRSNNDMAFIDGKIDEIDTEAETERLEESPQKYREHKDTLVRLSNAERGNKEILDDYSNLSASRALTFCTCFLLTRRFRSRCQGRWK